MGNRSQQHEKHDPERIIFRPDSAYVRTSVTAVIVVSALIICFMSVFLVGAISSEFHITSTLDFGVVMTFCSIASIICLILCWSSFLTSKRSYFDLVNGVLYPKGKNNAQIRYFYKDFDHLEIQNVLGGYALFLILKEGHNINILTNMLLEPVQEDAMQLAKRLSLPLQDNSVKIPQPQNFDITTDKVFITITSDDKD